MQPARNNPTGIADSPIRIVVTPSQSSYFAGETFSVTITFTNTSSPSSTGLHPYSSYASLTSTPTPTTPTPGPAPGQSQRTASSSRHKRASHSISSAPLARPPTSPGMSSRSVVVPEPGGVVSARMWGRGHVKTGVDSEMPSRKGLIGKLKDKEDVSPSPSSSTQDTAMTPTSTSAMAVQETTDGSTQGTSRGATIPKSKSDHLPDLIEQRRKRLLAKSLSVSISPRELEQQLPEGTLIRAGTPPLPISGSSSYSSLGASLGLGSPSSSTFAASGSMLGTVNEAGSMGFGGFGRSESESLPSSPSTTTTTSSALSDVSLESDSTAPSSSVVSLGLGSDVAVNGLPHTFGPPQFASTHDSSTGSQPVIGLGPPPKGFRSTAGLASSTYTTRQQLPIDAPSPPLHSAPPNMKSTPSQYHYGNLIPYHSQPDLPTYPSNRAIDPPPASPFLQPRTASATSFSIPPHLPPLPYHLQNQQKSELILYAYAHLSGWMILLPSPSHNHTHAPTSRRGLDQPYTMKKLRAKLSKKSVIGGGSMDITPSLQRIASGEGGGGSFGLGVGVGVGPGTTKKAGSRPPRLRARPTHGHSRSTSLAAGLISALLSPTTPSSPSSPKLPSALLPPQPLSPPPSIPSASSSMPSLTPPSAPLGLARSVSGPGGGVAKSFPGEWKDEEDPDLEVEVDPEVPLPMFESQQSMLAVDLLLAPGESKSYTYSIKLPDVLPPTFRGRCIRFSYEFSVGVCRSGSGAALNSTPSLSGGNGVSRVMKVPIRVYNYVAVGRVPRPYDLLWPVGRRIRERYIGTVVDAEKDKKSSSVTLEAEARPGSLEEFQEYARRMLEAAQNGGLQSTEAEDAREDDLHIGCREAVEILTRNPKKVSYDVSKDGVNVAMLAFTKSAYRLGETVLGVVEFNDQKGRARVLHMSATLEEHEKLPLSLSSEAIPLSRVHAEQHQSFVMSVLRTSFSLDIPSDASPAFQVEMGSEGSNGTGGLEWKVRLSLLVAIASEDAGGGTEGVRLKGMMRDGPRDEWGSAWRALSNIAPMEKVSQKDVPAQITGGSGGVRGWAWYLASALLGPSTPGEQEAGQFDKGDHEEYDGIKPDPVGGVGHGVNYDGGEAGWGEVKVELVECTVPLAIWAGDTAFKAVSVVFDL